MVSSLLEPWRETGRRDPPQSEKVECGPILRQCLSFADPRNQAVRAVASHRVPGARYTRGACRPSPADQKTRPGGSLPSAASEALATLGEGLDNISCPGPRTVAIGQQMVLDRPLVGASLGKNLLALTAAPPSSAVVVYLLLRGTRVSVCVTMFRSSVTP